MANEGLNKALLLGNLGSDPELRMTASGQAVMNFSLATNYRRKAGDHFEDVTEWHKIVVWGNRAEGLAKLLQKGDGVFVEGRICTRSYDDRDGNKRYVTEVFANHVILNGSRQTESRRPELPLEQPAEDDDDDIPF